MTFSLYFKKDSFNPKNRIVREAAVNDHVRAINNLRGGINEDFGVHKWVVVV
jgi:hypothetical protein